LQCFHLPPIPLSPRFWPRLQDFRKINNRLPTLVNLNEDPQLSEVLIYIIREGAGRTLRME
jgi:hypothetical protein